MLMNPVVVVVIKRLLELDLLVSRFWKTHKNPHLLKGSVYET